jgi:hypothetical protein
VSGDESNVQDDECCDCVYHAKLSWALRWETPPKSRSRSCHVVYDMVAHCNFKCTRSSKLQF